MAAFQVWLVRTLVTVNPVGRFMHTHWGWPAAESVHFIGLSLLVGTIALFDLRLLGMAKRIPIAALHKLIPWGVLGYGINVVSGSMFLMTEPDQYIYNPAFQFKLLFMALAGVNVLAFYLAVYPRAMTVRASGEAPRSAKIIAAASLCLWVAVIVCGRLLTFYRPGNCGPEGPGFLADCIPRFR
jgi:uncharacterized membrane protein